MVFAHRVGLKVLTFSVDLIGRYVNEALEGRAALGRLEQNVRSVNVRVGKGEGVSKGVVHVRLGGKVHDGVNPLLLEHIRHKIGRANVSLDKLEVRESLQLIEVGQACTVVELVVNDNVVLRVLFRQQDGHMGGDESCGRVE